MNHEYFDDRNCPKEPMCKFYAFSLWQLHMPGVVLGSSFVLVVLSGRYSFSLIHYDLCSFLA